ncbi:uncharacterized protein BO88DRAFT_438799 [Aspergillus vadensis CBS 113365]|uniref:Uncharacterized protein n=1 Tax=Aspergillus vadensis (strain CBS 113365 / IMI 142717 / IBT 24658) TaxID=1448311 RepID=A0A319AVD3_ASPVC|nr:hypothetical protein BO88DRAFT_438799 [Aspergillus vadensis CBS 113365]PYH64336.1 hypothetical protein BO88DRAFT_438799 [Aspergillus vadensis CBS 113365]
MSLGAALLSARHSFHANDLAPNDSAANNSLVQPQACPSATNMTSLYGSGLLGSGGNVVPKSSRPGAHGLRTWRTREAPSLPVASLYCSTQCIAHVSYCAALARAFSNPVFVLFATTRSRFSDLIVNTNDVRALMAVGRSETCPKWEHSI